MDTIKTLLANPVVVLALLLAILVIFSRVGRSAQRNRDLFILAEIALGLLILLLAGWQTIEAAETGKRQAARIQSLEASVREQTDRAVRFETAATQAQREKEVVKHQIAWREISETQSREFATLLWTSPKGKVYISYVTDDAEVAKYAVELGKMLRRTGYDAPEDLKGMIPISPMGPPIIGVKLSAQRQDNAIAGGLQQGLRRIGVDIKGRVNPAQQEDILVIVGRKSL